MADGKEALISNQPADWQTFNARHPIASSRLIQADLKKLYRILDDKQREYCVKLLSSLSKAEGESDDAFVVRKKTISRAFVTSVTIASEDGASLTSNNEAVFDSAVFPTRVASVFFTTKNVPNAVLKHLPIDRIEVFLDFSQSPRFDLARLPTLPTPNESNFEIVSNTETWFVGVRAKLQDFFAERKTANNWLHAAGAYDVLLYFFAFPFAVLLCVKMSLWLVWLSKLDEFPKVLFYVYTCFGTIILFRFGFSYARWAFPKFELEGSARSSRIHRRLIWTIVLGLLGSTLYDLGKGFLGWFL